MALSHFVVFATPLGLGFSPSRWSVLDLKNSVNGHTPGGHVQPGTFVPAVQLTSSQSSNDTSAEAPPSTSTGDSSNNEPEWSDGDTDSSSTDPETDSTEENSSDNASPSPSPSPSPDTSAPPSSSAKTNAALPAINIHTIILPVILTILSVGSGLF